MLLHARRFICYEFITKHTMDFSFIRSQKKVSFVANLKPAAGGAGGFCSIGGNSLDITFSSFLLVAHVLYHAFTLYKIEEIRWIGYGSCVEGFHLPFVFREMDKDTKMKPINIIGIELQYNHETRANAVAMLRAHPEASLGETFLLVYALSILILMLLCFYK
jgi:hypothetical protein